LLFSFENIYRQYLFCRKNKRNTINALRFEVNQEKELQRLCRELTDRTYRPGRSVCFYNKKPKLREIFAADFRDRIVHHVLVDYLEKIWEPIFIHDSYACRKSKGIHKGVERLGKFIRQVTENGSRKAWYLKLDIKNYFMSIDKKILFSLIRRKCPDPHAMWLSELLIFHDCTQNPLFKSDANTVHRLPSHKTLFHAEPGKGLPIGNLNSQFFANVYLNCLDQFVKHTLKCRFYLRYCDDFVLLSTSLRQLENWEKAIDEFLLRKLALCLNNKARRLQPVSNGINFLGYIVRKDYQLVRRRVIGNLQGKLALSKTALVTQEKKWCVYLFDQEKLDTLFSVICSYHGHFKHANSFRLVSAIWQKHSFLSRFFELDRMNNKVIRKYISPGYLHTVRQQYSYFQKLFTGDIIFFQVGSYFEFYDGTDNQVVRQLDLSPLKQNRRQARYGFPIAYISSYLLRALDVGKSVVVVREDNYLTKIKRRTVWRRYEPDCNSPGKK
jgi:RNA-directed DNA polymerase